MPAARKSAAPAEDITAGLEDDITAESKEEGVDLLADLESALETGDAQSWIPKEEGDTLVGVVTHVGTMNSDYSPEPIPYIEVQDREGEVWGVRGYGSVLAAKIEGAKLEVGDGVAVRFLGMQDSRNGRSYKNFAVRSRKPSTAS